MFENIRLSCSKAEYSLFQKQKSLLFENISFSFLKTEDSLFQKQKIIFFEGRRVSFSQEASGRHLRGIWEVSGRHLEGIWETWAPKVAPGSLRGLRLKKVLPLSAIIHLFIKKYERALSFRVYHQFCMHIYSNLE